MIPPGKRPHTRLSTIDFYHIISSKEATKKNKKIKPKHNHFMLTISLVYPLGSKEIDVTRAERHGLLPCNNIFMK